MGFSTWLVIVFVTAVLFEGAYTLYQFLKRRRERKNLEAYREQFYAELLKKHMQEEPEPTETKNEAVPINGAGGCCKQDK